MGEAKRVGKHLPEGLSADEVEELLLSKLNVRLTMASAMKAADQATLARLRQLDLGMSNGLPRAHAAESEESEDEDLN